MYLVDINAIIFYPLCDENKTSINKLLNMNASELYEKNKDYRDKGVVEALKYIFGLIIYKETSKVLTYDYLRTNTLDEIYKEYFDVLSKNTELYSIFNNILNPKKLKISNIKYEKIDINNNYEIWTEGPAVIIKDLNVFLN